MTTAPSDSDLLSVQSDPQWTSSGGTSSGMDLSGMIEELTLEGELSMSSAEPSPSTGGALSSLLTSLPCVKRLNSSMTCFAARAAAGRLIEWWVVVLPSAGSPLLRPYPTKTPPAATPPRLHSSAAPTHCSASPPLAPRA
jgi:hypothetical protein